MKKVTRINNKKKRSVFGIKNVKGLKDNVANVLVQNEINYTPKVSVIIPVYNVEQYLRECLDSVINQTLKEIEIICVDDGSTDNSLEVLKEYAKKDNRITVISRENKGVGFSRNQGIKSAKGEFVAFMDPDDYYPTETVLFELYSEAKKYNVNICGGTSLVIYDENKKAEIRKEDFFNRFTEGQLCKYSDFQYDYGYTLFIFNRKMLIKNDIVFPNYKRFQDPPFMVKAFICATEFYVTKAYVYAYRCAHKEINWTEERVYDLLSGFRDNLLMALQNNLENLYDLTLNRIKKEYKAIIAMQSSDRINKIKQEIMDVCIQYAHNHYKNDKTKAKVSVVLPIYNAEPYLRECLDSVINQTLKDIEVICVNDGSTDNSLNIIREYASKDKRIKYIDKPNAGYGQTMNSGIDLARGEYIGIVEPDDFIKLDMYETLYNKANKEKLDIAKANLSVFEDKNAQRFFLDVKYMIASDKYGVVDTPFNLQDYMNKSFNTCCALYRRGMLIENKIRYNETPGAAYQDVSFWFKTHCTAKKMVVLDEHFYMYRQDNPNQSIRNPKLGDYLIAEHAMVYEFITKNNLNKFIPLCLAMKVGGFLWYLSKIFGEYKNSFLDKIHAEFLDMQKNTTLDFKYFDEYTKKMFNLIASDEYDNLKHIGLSIIICAYNGEDYIQECLDSVINQTLKDIEIICVNDGSTDKTLDIMNEYAKIDNRIKVINHENVGLAASRNRALEIASGEYVMFVDCDDYIRLDAAYLLYHYAADNDQDMLSFSGNNFYNDSKELLNNPYWNFEWLPKKFNLKKFNHTDCLHFMHKMAVSSCLTIYKRDFIKQNDIKFPDGLCFEDNVFFLKSLIQAKSCGILNEKLYYRRIHSLSITQNWNSHFGDFLQVTIIVLEYLKKSQINEQTFTNYVNLHLEILLNNFVKLNRTDKRTYIKDVKKILKQYDKSKLAVLRKKSRLKSYLLFPYYGMATIWMNLISLPLAKLKHRIKQFLYSRSYRGKMDVLNAKFADVLRSVQSVKNDISQQIVQLNKQQNELVKQISDVDVKQRKLVNDNYLVLSKQISDLATYVQDKSDVVDKQISDLATYVQRKAKIVDENFSKIEEDVGLKSEVLFGQVADLKTIIKSETDKLFEQVQDVNNKHQIEILSDKLDVAQAEIVDKTKSVIEHLAGAKSELVNEIDTLHKSGQDANNNIVNQFGMIKSFADVLAKKYSEPYWANVYHDTINNTNWLNNKSVSPGRWAVSYVVLYVLYRILDEIKPQSILECGLGQSSKLTIQYADSHKADLTICENNSDWLSFFQRQFPTADIYTKILDTEMINVVPGYESRTYVGFDNVIKNKKFDFVLIDGPLGSQHYSRPEVLSVVNNLDKSFVILMDDMNRVCEQETFEALKNKLRENNIDFKEGFYESDKRLGLICSPDLEWLTTL